LKEIRNFCRPIEKKELDTHKDEYYTLKRQRLEEIKNKRMLEQKTLE